MCQLQTLSWFDLIVHTESNNQSTLTWTEYENVYTPGIRLIRSTAKTAEVPSHVEQLLLKDMKCNSNYGAEVFNECSSLTDEWVTDRHLGPYGRRSVGGQGDVPHLFWSGGDALCFVPLFFRGRHFCANAHGIHWTTGTFFLNLVS